MSQTTNTTFDGLDPQFDCFDSYPEPFRSMIKVIIIIACIAVQVSLFTLIDFTLKITPQPPYR